MAYGLVCGAVAVLLGPTSARAAEALSAPQRAWVASHVVRFAPERDYGPFVFTNDQGQAEGLSIDMLRLLTDRTGLRLQMEPAAPLQGLLQAVQARQIDLLSSLRPTPERAAFLDFTRPYVSVPAVLVQRAGDAPLALAALAGRPVAVGQGYAVEAVMRLRHPQVNWVAVRDDVVALRGVVERRYDAAVADSASVAFVQQRHGLTGLQAGQQVGFDYTLSFGVRRDWPELTAVLNAAIQSLPAADRQVVLARWLPADAPPPSRAPWATRVGLALLALAGALGGGLLWWRRRRSRAGAA